LGLYHILLELRNFESLVQHNLPRIIRILQTLFPDIEQIRNRLLSPSRANRKEGPHPHKPLTHLYTCCYTGLTAVIMSLPPESSGGPRTYLWGPIALRVLNWRKLLPTVTKALEVCDPLTGTLDTIIFAIIIDGLDFRKLPEK
jgi:hypothetical protein